MICSMCFCRPCDGGDSLGSSQGLCQDCWESACSAEWWEAVAALATADEQRLQAVRDPETEDSA